MLAHDQTVFPGCSLLLTEKHRRKPMGKCWPHLNPGDRWIPKKQLDKLILLAFEQASDWNHKCLKTRDLLDPKRGSKLLQKFLNHHKPLPVTTGKSNNTVHPNILGTKVFHHTPSISHFGTHSGWLFSQGHQKRMSPIVTATQVVKATLSSTMASWWLYGEQIHTLSFFYHFSVLVPLLFQVSSFITQE